MAVSPFIPESPFINSCAQSTAVAWSLGKATKLFDVHVFFISMTFISIYKLRFGSDSSCRKTTFVFFMFFLLIFSQDRLTILFQWNFWLLCFCQSPRLFQPPRLLTLEVFANLPVYCTLPVYYFGQNLPVSPFIPPSPSIWNSRVPLSNFRKR